MVGIGRRQKQLKMGEIMALTKSEIRGELGDHILTVDRRSCTDLRLMAITLIRAMHPGLNDDLIEGLRLIIYRKAWRAELIKIVRGALHYCYYFGIYVCGLPEPLPMNIKQILKEYDESMLAV